MELVIVKSALHGAYLIAQTLATCSRCVTQNGMLIAVLRIATGPSGL